MSSDLINAAIALPPAERIEFIGRLWDSLADDGIDVAIPPAQMSEIERRTARLERTGPQGEPWEVVKARLLDERRA